MAGFDDNRHAAGLFRNKVSIMLDWLTGRPFNHEEPDLTNSNPARWPAIQPILLRADGKVKKEGLCSFQRKIQALFRHFQGT